MKRNNKSNVGSILLIILCVIVTMFLGLTTVGGIVVGESWNKDVIEVPVTEPECDFICDHADCSYVEAVEGVECDYIHEHGSDCSYLEEAVDIDAVECDFIHEHDTEVCSFVAAVEGVECDGVCPVDHTTIVGKIDGFFKDKANAVIEYYEIYISGESFLKDISYIQVSSGLLTLSSGSLFICIMGLVKKNKNNKKQPKQNLPGKRVAPVGMRPTETNTKGKGKKRGSKEEVAPQPVDNNLHGVPRRRTGR